MAKKLLQLLADNRKTAGRGVRIVQQAREATIYLYDSIVSTQLEADWWGGIAAQDLVPQIDGLAVDTIHVRINSPGGDVFAARAIAAALERNSAKCIAHVDGYAASAATAVACACDEVRMSEGAMYMIHNAWTIAMGDKNDFIETAGLLEKVDGVLAAAYAECTGKPAAEITKLMDAETWFTAQEAVDYGFAKAIEGEEEADEATAKAKASVTWNLSAFEKAPKAKDPPAPQTPTAQQIGLRERAAAMNAQARYRAA
jgi:ATP-dependent Clp protease protease subunit